MTTRIALIHAVAVAIAPVEAAFRELWPEAECCNLLDDSLSLDRERDGVLTAAMSRRIAALAEYAAATGAVGILFTCSAFGQAIEAAAARAAVPMLKPNEAMFEAALAAGRRIGMLATFAPSVPSMEAEFRDMAAMRRRTPVWSPRRRAALPIMTRCSSPISRRRAPRTQPVRRWAGRC
jgi:Asp/Glu/hydantoin racemase